eukprot:3126609-Amphidinium_carterae.1
MATVMRSCSAETTIAQMVDAVAHEVGWSPADFEVLEMMSEDSNDRFLLRADKWTSEARLLQAYNSGDLDSHLHRVCIQVPNSTRDRSEATERGDAISFWAPLVRENVVSWGRHGATEQRTPPQAYYQSCTFGSFVSMVRCRLLKSYEEGSKTLGCCTISDIELFHSGSHDSVQRVRGVPELMDSPLAVFGFARLESFHAVASHKKGMVKAILTTAASLNAFIMVVEDGTLDLNHSGSNRWLGALADMDITHLLGQRPSVLATMRALGLETRDLPTKASPTYGLQRQVKSVMRFVSGDSVPDVVGVDEEEQPPAKTLKMVAGATAKKVSKGPMVHIPPPPPRKETVAAKKRPSKPVVPRGSVATSSQGEIEEPIAPWRSSQASSKPPSLQDISEQDSVRGAEKRTYSKTKLRLASKNQREVIAIPDNDAASLPLEAEVEPLTPHIKGEDPEVDPYMPDIDPPEAQIDDEEDDEEIALVGQIMTLSHEVDQKLNERTLLRDQLVQLRANRRGW